MIEDLADQRCFNHARREAVARCPECGRYFCRECVTEHDDRMICASCLAKLTGAQEPRKARLIRIARLAQFAMGIITLWLFFYFLGMGLLALPSSFHENAIYKAHHMGR